MYFTRVFCTSLKNVKNKIREKRDLKKKILFFKKTNYTSRNNVKLFLSNFREVESENNFF